MKADLEWVQDEMWTVEGDGGGSEEGEAAGGQKEPRSPGAEQGEFDLVEFETWLRRPTPLASAINKGLPLLIQRTKKRTFPNIPYLTPLFSMWVGASWFENLILMLVTLNVGTMLLVHHGQSQGITDLLKVGAPFALTSYYPKP